MSDSGAPASTSAAETARVRGVAFGCAKVAVSITIPAISSVASAPSARSSGMPRRTASSATISQVAAATGSTQSAGPVGVVRGVVVDDHPRQVAEQVGVPLGDRPDALRRRAVGQHEQVVGDAGLGLRAGTASTPGRKAYSGGGASENIAVARPPSDSTIRHTASVAPSVSASGFSWPTASTSRAPRSRARTSGGTASPASAARSTGAVIRGDGRACPTAAACRVRPARPVRRHRPARGPRPGRTRGHGVARRLPGPRPLGRRLGRVGGVALVGQPRDRRRQRLLEGHDRLRVGARLQLVEEMQDARPPLGGVVEPDVQLRDALDPQPPAELVAHERHRLLEGADRLRRSRPDRRSR